MAELSRRFDIHPNQITQWKNQLLERAEDVFGSSTEDGRGLSSEELKVLYANACGALAYAPDSSAIPALQELLDHPDQKTKDYAAATIDGIQSDNDHYFSDRNHTGKVFWHPGHYPYGDR